MTKKSKLGHSRDMHLKHSAGIHLHRPRRNRILGIQ